MARLRSAFTLIELLTVVGILALIASILMPVFGSVKLAAGRSSCLSNFRQVGAASSIYASDYDDLFVLVNHQPAEAQNSRNDRTWVQLLLPYVRTFQVFQCPGDTSDRPKPESSFDSDLVPGDIYSRYYSASQRVNIGYNFQYLAPIYNVSGVWTSMPRSYTSVQDPSKTVHYLDSVWSVNNGRPTGGGSWLVSPPCRYERTGDQVIDTFTAARGPSASPTTPSQVFEPVKGWEPNAESSPNMYGGAWPWHSNRLNVIKVDGSARSMTLQGLTSGCEVLPSWQGAIYDPGIYPWNPNQ